MLQTFTLILLAYPGWTQHRGDSQVTSLVSAEQAFAAMAKEQNTRDAFLHFLADDAITVKPGGDLRRGKKHLEEQTPNDSWLSWRPVVSLMAASGDFGYNAGAWEFRNKKTDTEAVAFGHFVSLWKKNVQGEWKVVVDMGISHPKPVSRYALNASVMNGKQKRSSYTQDSTGIFSEERKLIDALKQGRTDPYGSVPANDVKFFRTGHVPYGGKEFLRLFGNADDGQKIEYSLSGGQIATSGDLACVYGKASITREGAPSSHHGYLRLWKKENGHWKIVVDLLSD